MSNKYFQKNLSQYESVKDALASDEDSEIEAAREKTKLSTASPDLVKKIANVIEGVPWRQTAYKKLFGFEHLGRQALAVEIKAPETHRFSQEELNAFLKNLYAKISKYRLSSYFPKIAIIEDGESARHPLYVQEFIEGQTLDKSDISMDEFEHKFN